MFFFFRKKHSNLDVTQDSKYTASIYQKLTIETEQGMKYVQS